MPYRKKTQVEAQPILSKRRNNTLVEAEEGQQYALAGLVITCLAQGNPVYLTPGKFGGVQFKVYIEGDQFAEYLELNDGLSDLVEEIIETLYDIKQVAEYRKSFGAGRAGRASKAPRAGVESKDTGEGGKGA